MSEVGESRGISVKDRPGGALLLETEVAEQWAGSVDCAPPPRMTARILQVSEIAPDDERAWRELAERAAEHNPFYEPDCLIPAAKHQSFGSEIRLAVAESDGRFHGCVPFRAVKRWKFPYPVLTSQVRRMNGLGTPLIDPERGVDAAAALLTALAAERSPLHGRLFILDTAGAEGPVSLLIREAAQRLGFWLCSYETWDRGKLVRNDGQKYERTVSYKSRRNLRRQMRLLGDAVGGPVEVEDRSTDPACIDEYIALEASGYKSHKGVAMTTVPGEPEYFREMCSRFMASRRLQVLTLQAGSQVIAMQMWIKADEGAFLWKGSYDESYAQFGPGVLLHTVSIDFFNNETDSAWMDSCTGPDHKLLFRLYPVKRPIEFLAIVLGQSRIDRTVVRAFMAWRPLHSRYYKLTRPNHAVPGNEGSSKVATPRRPAT